MNDVCAFFVQELILSMMNFNQHLEKLRQEVISISDLIKEDFLPMTESQLNFRAGKDQWSVFECIEHLNRYYRFYNPEIRNAIAIAEPKSNEVTVTSTWIGRLSIRMMHPDNRKKKKTFKHMNPIHVQLSATTIHEFLQHQQEFLLLLEQATGVDLNAKLVKVEFMKLLRMNIAESLEFVVIHIKRHIFQAEGVSQGIPTNSILVL